MLNEFQAPTGPDQTEMFIITSADSLQSLDPEGEWIGAERTVHPGDWR